MEKLNNINEMFDAFEYGLTLPVPILVSDGRDGGEDYFMRCGDRYYIYLDIPSNLLRVEEPTDLSKVLRTLGDSQWRGLRLTECYRLPEYGGTETVADELVPPGWSNRVNQEVSANETFHHHNIYVPRLLLFREGAHGLPALYLVKGFNPPRFYLWDIDSNKICKIERPNVLQDILDTLEGYFDKLELSNVKPQCRPRRPK
ncbi:hypothetical protein IMSHALPRED_005990 [Imshaugia aleurites]|uniref:Uncharacterized protein n=1 Tax=Imshaugia aleurites TaxID=172621 RepID=A0A8H3FEB9_9LECA|nr:hypothetical protein IMSHALPRED_005990 [Imshaugia aleurites]